MVPEVRNVVKLRCKYKCQKCMTLNKIAFSRESPRLLQFGNLISLQSLYVFLPSFLLFLMFLGSKLVILTQSDDDVPIKYCSQVMCFMKFVTEWVSFLLPAYPLGVMTSSQYYKFSWNSGLDFTAWLGFYSLFHWQKEFGCRNHPFHQVPRDSARC